MSWTLAFMNKFIPFCFLSVHTMWPIVCSFFHHDFHIIIGCHQKLWTEIAFVRVFHNSNRNEEYNRWLNLSEILGIFCFSHFQKTWLTYFVFQLQTWLLPLNGISAEVNRRCYSICPVQRKTNFSVYYLFFPTVFL